MRQRGTKQIWFLSHEAEGNVAHKLLGRQAEGNETGIFFGVNWLREGSKYFVSSAGFEQESKFAF